jgi:hypothetical protein
MTDPWSIAVEVPAKTARGRKLGLPALHNLGGGRWAAMPIVKEHKRLLQAALDARHGEPLPPVLDSERCYDVLIVRVSRHPLDWGTGDRVRSIQGDNIGSALKAWRDQLAKWLDCEGGDRDPRVRWFVGQRWGPAKYVGVEVYLATWAEQWWTLQDRFLRGEL